MTSPAGIYTGDQGINDRARIVIDFMYHDENRYLYHEDVMGTGNTDEAVVVPVSCGFGRIMHNNGGYTTT